MDPFYQNQSATIYLGHCLSVLKTLPTDSVDAVVTDPPAGINFMGKGWDDFRRLHNPADAGRHTVHGRMSARGPENARRGRMAFVEFMTAVMSECLRVMKPGAHGLVWSIPRTSHWTAWALEEAGFEIRDRIGHLFGSGFPKSLDVGRSVDSSLCELPGRHYWAETSLPKGLNGRPDDHVCVSTEPGQRHAGDGTSLKPACEDWWLIRKPLIGTVASNVLAHGTGALNIGDCRVAFADAADAADAKLKNQHADFHSGPKTNQVFGKFSADRENYDAQARWPANIITDGSSEVLDVLPQTGSVGHFPRTRGNGGISTSGHSGGGDLVERHLEAGSAARYFYTAKASKEDREEGLEDLAARQQDGSRKEGHPGGDNPRNRGLKKRANHHPTVKPTSLMRYLCRLITQPGGVVLDPFMGSGSTGKAAYLEGLRFIGIDDDKSYCEIAARRCELRQRSLFAAK